MLDFFYRNKTVIFTVLIILAGLNFIIFGFNKIPPDGDALGYVDSAKNMVVGDYYTLDGGIAGILREPGYSFFMAFIFKLFGTDNFLAVKIAQVVLLACVAFLIYLSFELYSFKKSGLLAAILTAAVPFYGYYANALTTEAFLLFLLGLIFYLTLRAVKKNENMFWYAVTGFVCGIVVLTRVQLALFSLLLGLVLLYLKKNPRNIITYYLVFLVCIGSWAGYVYYRSGELAITKGRSDFHLYARAARSKLSYGQEISYLIDWLKRSASGGVQSDTLARYEIWSLLREYYVKLQQGQSAQIIKQENIATIFHNLGHYLFGNIIEWIKLMYIEHLFPPVSIYLNRLVRVGFYLGLYVFFLRGILQFYKRQTAKPLFWLAGAFLAYNWIISSFFDATPRYNTPYIVFYLLIGILGIANLLENFDKSANLKGNNI